MHHAFLLVYMKVQSSTSVRLQPPHSARGNKEFKASYVTPLKLQLAGCKPRSFCGLQLMITSVVVNKRL